MTAQEHIINKLKSLKAPSINLKPTPENELPDFVFNTVMNKHFRKYSVTPEYQIKIKTAIKINLQKNEPIKLKWGFGAYKLWRLPEAPEADWAELFSFMYFFNWLKPICDIYEPGVNFEFSSHDMLVSPMNNIPKEDIVAYNKSFHDLMDFTKNYLPKNFNFSFSRTGSHLTQQEFETKLMEKVSEWYKQGKDKIPLTQHEIAATELNVKLKEDQDKDPLWKEKIHAIHRCFFILKKEFPNPNSEEKITVGNIPYPNSISVGTTKSSVAKFWVGVGALKKQNDSYMEHVLSPTQLEKIHFTWEPVEIGDLTGKNFHQIRIF